VKIWTVIEAACSAAGGFMGWLLGGFDGLIRALLILAVIDWITGLVRAIVNREVSSKTGFIGIVKKFVMFLIVAVASVIDTYFINMLSFTGDNGSIIRDAVILFFAVNEGISILENAALLGIPVPDQLKNALLKLRGKKDKAEDEPKQKNADYDNVDFDYDGKDENNENEENKGD